MECVARITMSVYHCQAEKREPLFQEASQCCNQLLAIIWDNREDMVSSDEGGFGVSIVADFANFSH